MNNLDEFSTEDLNKLSKANLLALVKADRDRKRSEPANSMETLTLKNFELLLDKKLSELSFVFATRVETIEKDVLAIQSELEKLKASSALITSLQKENELLRSNLNDFKTVQNDSHPSSIASNSNELLIFGIEEVKASSPNFRFESLNKDVTKCIAALGGSSEECVTDFHRIGRFQENKIRPILVRVNSIWSKRKLLAEYSKRKLEGNVTFVLKTRPLDSPQFRSARQKAKELNDLEKVKALSTGSSVQVSFSPRPTGTIVKYALINNKWLKSNEEIPA